MQAANTDNFVAQTSELSYKWASWVLTSSLGINYPSYKGECKPKMFKVVIPFSSKPFFFINIVLKKSNIWLKYFSFYCNISDIYGAWRLMNTRGRDYMQNGFVHEHEHKNFTFNALHVLHIYPYPLLFLILYHDSWCVNSTNYVI